MMVLTCPKHGRRRNFTVSTGDVARCECGLPLERIAEPGSVLEAAQRVAMLSPHASFNDAETAICYACGAATGHADDCAHVALQVAVAKAGY